MFLNGWSTQITHMNLFAHAKQHISEVWWYTLDIPALRRWKQGDREFKVILTYTESWRAASAIRDPVSKNK